MADYLRDLKEVIQKGEGSELRRKTLLRKVDRLGLDLRKAGYDVNREPQERLCLAMEPQNMEKAREWMFRLCMARLTRGDYSDWTGWEFRNEWATASYAAEIKNRRWRLEPVKSIAVLGEQGIGDEIMFASCIQDLKARVPDIVYECDPRLVEIFKRCLGVRAKAREDIAKRGEEVVNYLTMKRPEEAFIPAGDLPRLFRKHWRDFPRHVFLSPLPEMVEKWSHLKGRVGVAWRSRTGKVDPKEVGLDNPVCLQYDHWEYETEGMTVPECDLRNDVEDILGICANLSKLVTTPNTAVHFAGSIGTKVEVILPPNGTGRVKNTMPYRYTKPMPWYKDVTVYDNMYAYKTTKTA